MANSKQSISEVVDNLDLLSEPIAEHKINGAINLFIKEQERKEIPPQWLAEAMAFDFVQNYQSCYLVRKIVPMPIFLNPEHLLCPYYSHKEHYIFLGTVQVFVSF